MMIILKGELTSVFNSIKRAGANLSLSDASGVHAGLRWTSLRVLLDGKGILFI